jgi:UDP-N-acetylmuramate--alanine ligase
MFVTDERAHFVGIGGVGMSGIAECLLRLGFSVSGSDAADSPSVKRLRDAGARVYIGHDAAKLGRPAVVVVSSAVKKDNPEVVAALKAGIPVIQRAEMLAELMRLRKGIAIAGTHGKTTTTCLVGSVFQSAGLDPTTIVGGKFFNIGSNARYGKGEYLVCEADESDGSFLRLTPIVGVVTNIDNDHMDYYGTEDRLVEAFRSFVHLVPFYGCAVVCGDDLLVRRAIKGATKNCFSYGFGARNDYTASDVKTASDGMSFRVQFRGRSLGRFLIRRFGRHMVLNALAAVAVSHRLELDMDRVRKGLAGFQGVGRRMELVGNARGVTVYDDYAHHPTEIKATLSAFRMMRPKGGRAIGIFQPHRYSRTKLLAAEFGDAFRGLDILIMTDIYAASERPLKGVDGRLIASRVKGVKKVIYVRDKSEIPATVIPLLRPKDMLITLGAGDIYKTGREIFSRLERSADG